MYYFILTITHFGAPLVVEHGFEYLGVQVPVMRGTLAEEVDAWLHLLVTLLECLGI